MTSFEDHRSWQDVYHVPSEVGLLYVKFTADAWAYRETVAHGARHFGISDWALRIMKIRADHLLPSDKVRRIRKKLGLTQREAGELIGGGPNAFQKYGERRDPREPGREQLSSGSRASP